MFDMKNKPKILESNSLYLVIAFILLTVGSIAQSKDIFIGLLITEYIIVLLPILIFLKIRGYKIKKVLKLNKISLKESLLIPLITLSFYPIAAFFNALIMILISLFGELNPPPLPQPTSGGNFLIGLFIIAISPGICEEIMFRGFIMKSYEHKGYKKAILISGILFGIFHFNFQNLMGPLLLGILFGFLVYKTNSLYASIIAHTTNNAFAWTISYIFTNLGTSMESTSELTSDISQTTSLVMGTLALGAIASVTGLIAYYLYKKLPDRNKFKEVDESLEKQEIEKRGLLKYIPLIIVIIGYIVSTVIMFK